MKNNLLDSQRKCFLDVGANVASTSIYAIRSNQFTHSISIEPSLLNYKFLIWNTVINNLQDKIHPLNYGIADFTGNKALICSPTNCGDFRLSPKPEDQTNNLFNEKEFELEQVKFSTLDELAKDGFLKASETGFIWMDCQGSEGLIFKGGQQFLYETNRLLQE